MGIFNRLGAGIISVLFLLSILSAVFAIDSTGLVSYWKMNEGSGSTTIDSISNTNGDILSGATWVDAKYGKGLLLDGSSGIDASTSDLIGDGEVSVCAWIYPASTPSAGGQVIITNEKFSVWITDDSKVNMTNNAVNFSSGSDPSIIIPGEYFICVTRDSTSVINFFINGVQSAEYDQTGHGAAVIGNATTIGKAFPSGTGFEGTIDELSVWNKQLNSSEVSELYALGGEIPLPTDSTPPTITAPADIALEATGALTIVDLGTPVVSDDTDPTPAVDNNSPAAGFSVGTTVVEWIATDNSGNSSNAFQQVTISDTTPPAITVPANIGIEAMNPTGAIVTFDSPTASDLVDGSVIVSCTKNSGELFPIGVTTVSCTAQDSLSNSSNASFDVNVFDGAPVITLTGSNPQIIGLGESYTELGATANDNVDGAITVTDINSLDVNASVIGDYNVFYNAVDSNGNVAVTVVRTVRVVDNNSPTMTALSTSVSSRDVRLDFNATDNIGINHYEIRKGDNNWLDVSNTNSTTDTNFTFTNLSNATYVFFVRAVDDANNASTDLNASETVNVSTGGNRTGGPSYTYRPRVTADANTAAADTNAPVSDQNANNAPVNSDSNRLPLQLPTLNNSEAETAPELPAGTGAFILSSEQSSFIISAIVLIVLAGLAIKFVGKRNQGGLGAN